MPLAAALTHVAFEDPGTLGDELVRRGYRVEILDACTADLSSRLLREAEMLIVMGGPIGAYEARAYPFLDEELRLLKERLGRNAPTLGICLGSQLMSAAIGSRVFPGGRGRELGWAPLQPGRDVARCPAMTELLQPELAVLHWHGDTFDLPPGAAHLAATDAYENQAWALGERVLALQFHPEVTVSGLERWYVGHALELATARIDVPALRAQSQRFGARLQAAAGQFWQRWLDAALEA